MGIMDGEQDDASSQGLGDDDRDVASLEGDHDFGDNEGNAVLCGLPRG